MPTLLKQEQPTFGSLAGNGRTFEVPPFQRDYSWDKEEWEDLWFDLLGIDEAGDHYMGYVVLQETKESKHLLIIDGQQRITTISMLIIAAVKLISDRGDLERAELLRNTYLSYKEPTSLIYKTKLKLNRNNDYIYSAQLLQLQIPPFIASLKPSEKRLVGAFKYFHDELSHHFKDKETASIAAFISKQVDEKLFFTSIIVRDDIDAYKVFETLNARGVKLSSADLLKNYLFSKVNAQSAGEVESLELKWYRINDLLGKTDITTYIQHFWNSRNHPVERKNSLFKTIKNKVDSYKLSIEMIHSLDANAVIYAALNNPDSEIWTGEQSIYLGELNILEVTQCYPLLMVAKWKFTEQEFIKLLRDTVAILFRYIIIGGQNPNELERVFGKAAVAVFNGEITQAKALFTNHLKSVYIEDNSFKNDFKTKQINTNKYNYLVKYILAKLEIQYGGSALSLNSKNLTIEHILPEAPTEDWVNSFQHVHFQDYLYRIGNLTLLEAAKNKEVARKPFEEKQTIYLTSNFKLSCEQTNYNIWNAKSIADRQTDMANKAAAIWKINY